ncbi:hypothetical protein [Sporosarcina newyorkensis]|uniref:hypothetical protein n=1 Tax=Sporosarcina newyorkensis TaxID=759851 RepID=UPI003D0590C1
MKLLFQEQIVEFEQRPSADDVIEAINKLLKRDFYFGHLVADGVEITEEPELFLTKELGTIESLVIIGIPAKEFINDLLLSAEEYTERAKPYISNLFNAFYNNPAGEDWASLAELFEGIQWLSTMIDTVAVSTVCPTNWATINASVAELQCELKNLEEALENTDTVLIADMLQYEVLPVFEEIAKEIKEIIDTEGMRHDLN